MKHFGNSHRLLPINTLYIFVLTLSILLFTDCSPKDRPDDSFVIEKTLASEKQASPKIILQRKINLDESPDLELLYLVRNGTSEHISVIKGNQEKGWDLLWKKSFSLMNIGPLIHSPPDNKWVPVTVDKGQAGYILKKILAEELPGDSFNSIFIELLSEDPQLGLFSVPMGYRKGTKILDGFSVLKDHPNLKTTKRGEFEYKKADKSILVYPKDKNWGLEFVFNGFEMIPNLSSQPIPSIIKLEKKEGKYRIEFKNRGGFNTTTYITLSFPQGGKTKAPNDPNIKAYQKGDSVYSKTREKFVPASYTMIEATKPSWGTNIRYAFEFEYEGEADYLLYRVSYRYNRAVETIPNSFSIVQTEVDQQGFLCYKIPFPN